MGFDLQLRGGNLEIFFTILCVCFTWLEMSEGLFKKTKKQKKRSFTCTVQQVCKCIYVY